jgi:FO synthase
VAPRASLSAPLSDDDALALVDGDLTTGGLSVDICAAACSVRDSLFGRVVTYSPKVFLPLTNLCRNHCD